MGCGLKLMWVDAHFDDIETTELYQFGRYKLVYSSKMEFWSTAVWEGHASVHNGDAVEGPP